MDMKLLFEDLAKTKLVRVTGSYADGTQTDNSDIDFKVKEDRPDLPRGAERNIEKIIKIVERHGIKLGSSTTGAVHSHMQSGNGYLPIQIEFYDGFKKRPNKLPEVVLEGVRFKTY